MSDYFDNNPKTEWIVTDDKVILKTDHGDHYHTLDLTRATLEDMYSNLGQTLGDAHRAAPHVKK